MMKQPRYTIEEMDKRCDTVDRQNAVKIIEAKHNAEVQVDSVAS
jgi:hypothetical protein